MRKQLTCPVCGFKRLVDADENTKSELCEETQIKKWLETGLLCEVQKMR